MRKADYAAKPQAINRSFGVPAAFENKPAAAIVRDAFKPVRQEFEGKEGRELVEGWARVIQRYGHWSMFRFLTEAAKLDERTIDLIGTVENLTSRLHLAFVHSFIGASLISPDTAFFELPGGTGVLADAMYERVKDLVRLDRRATRISHGTDGVEVETVSEGRDGKPVVRQTFRGDRAIITVPFSGLRHIPVTPALSYGKRRAITEIHYDAATKVLLEFSRRWWEFEEKDWKRELERIKPGLYDAYRLGKAPADGSLLGSHPSVPPGHLPPNQRVHYAAYRATARNQPEAPHVIGGGSVTDNANRFMYQPSHPVEGSAGGVVLASYSWADDALKWDSLDDDERYPHALGGMQDVYGQRVEVFYTGAGATQSWMRDPYAYGEASVLLPGQHTELLADVRSVEGPLHFAGDHTSVKPAWIEGRWSRRSGRRWRYTAADPRRDGTGVAQWAAGPGVTPATSVTPALASSPSPPLSPSPQSSFSGPTRSRASSVAPATAPGIRNTATNGTRKARPSGTPKPRVSRRRPRSRASRSFRTMPRRWSATAVSSSARK